MISSFSPVTGDWQIAWPGRVARHDVVYLSPPEDPMLGLPVGNGDLGALIWLEGSRLMLALNKCDAWDDNEPRPFASWEAAEEEHHTSLRYAARLIVDFGAPVFDLVYQSGFTGRLSLADATARFSAETPFSKVDLCVLGSHSYGVVVVHGTVERSEPVATEVTLERWGSRTFAHWYSQVRRDASLGLAGTETTAHEDDLVVRQRFRTQELVVAARIVTTSGFSIGRLHSRAGRFTLQANERAGFTIYLTAVTSLNAADPMTRAVELLDTAEAAGLQVLRDSHASEWRRFWLASFISLPDDYLENIWYLTLYFAHSASRGTYPPHFCNGLWGWNRDFVPWNYYFHWNMQWYAWPLHAANHAELAMPYLQYRRAQLPQAVCYARECLGRPGAFYADVADRRGYNDKHLNENLTPGPQIALDFWRHYRFTNDEGFLRDMAWPVMREVARFMVASTHLGDDGSYCVAKSSAYEGSPLFLQTVTTMAALRALLPAAASAARLVDQNLDEALVWEQIAGRLAPFVTIRLEDDEIAWVDGRPVYAHGIGAGRALTSDHVFAAGIDPVSGYPVRNRYGGRGNAYYGIPDPELSPVFPSGVVGLCHRSSELFRMAVSQVRLHPRGTPQQQGVEGTMATSGELCMGWCPYPVVLARLGLADELVEALRESVSTWQFYPQGFGHYGPYHVFHNDMTQRWRTNEVRDADARDTSERPSRFRFPAWPFRHFDNEAMPIVATAINEALLQSYEGRIRLCPAIPATWDVGFTLAAEDGFLVSAECRAGQIQWVAVFSRLGRPCRVVRPWDTARPVFAYEWSGSEWVAVPFSVESLQDDCVLAFPTRPAGRYLLVASKDDAARWEVTEASVEPNGAPKRLGQAILGRERHF